MSDENIVDFPQKQFAEDYNDVIELGLQPDGTVMLHMLDEAPAVAINGGHKCDVIDGPCSCGAWHSKGEPGREWTDEYIGYCRLNGKEPGE